VVNREVMCFGSLNSSSPRAQARKQLVQQLQDVKYVVWRECDGVAYGLFGSRLDLLQLRAFLSWVRLSVCGLVVCSPHVHGKLENAFSIISYTKRRA